MPRYQVISVQDARSRGGDYATAVAAKFPNEFQDLLDEHGAVIWRRGIEGMILWDTEGPGSPRIFTSKRVPDDIIVALHNAQADQITQLRADNAQLSQRITALAARVTVLEP